MDRKITLVKIYPISFPLNYTLTWGAGKSLGALNHLLIEVRCGEFVGYGEAVPRKAILGETQETVIDYLKSISSDLRFEVTKEGIDRFSNEMFSTEGNLTAKSAINCALYELLGQIEGRSARELLGFDAGGIGACTILPQLEGRESFFEKIKQLVGAGVKGFKVKLTGKEEKDEEIFSVLKEFSSCKFYIDGNELYTLETAKRLVDRVAELSSVLYLEEPIPVENVSDRQELVRYIESKRHNLLIVGDDSCKTFAGIKKQIALRTVTMINVKVPRTGISEGVRIMDYCKEKNVPVMIGSHAAYIIGAYHSWLLAHHPIVTSTLNEIIYWMNVSVENDIVKERGKLVDGKLTFERFPEIDFEKISSEPVVITLD